MHEWAGLTAGPFVFLSGPTQSPRPGRLSFPTDTPRPLKLPKNTDHFTLNLLTNRPKCFTI
jgi:hypothetical protein